MTAFTGIALALVKGFVRDRSALFFTMLFPLMFLVLFGTLFSSGTNARLDLVQVGPVAPFDDLPSGARGAFEKTFEVTRTDDRAEALSDVREGDADVALEMVGDQVVAHFSRADPQRSGLVRGALSAFVDTANIAATGQPPRYGFRAEAVEDDSLDAIQFFTPGLLGWAVAMSATVAAAATLQGWRQSRLLHRLQLSPARPAVVVTARTVVTVGIAFAQMGVFLLVAGLLFDLQLTGSWWLSIPLLLAATLSFMALGLLAGAIGKTAEGAVNIANFIVMPMAFLSGSFFPLDAAPGWLQSISWVMPLRHFNEGMSDVMFRGLDLDAVAMPLAYILVFAVVVSAAAVVLFRRVKA